MKIHEIYVVIKANDDSDMRNCIFFVNLKDFDPDTANWSEMLHWSANFFQIVEWVETIGKTFVSFRNSLLLCDALKIYCFECFRNKEGKFGIKSEKKSFFNKKKLSMDLRKLCNVFKQMILSVFVSLLWTFYKRGKIIRRKNCYLSFQLNHPL